MTDLYTLKKLTGKPIRAMVKQAIVMYIKNELYKFEREVVESIKKEEGIVTPAELKVIKQKQKKEQINI